MLLALIAPNYVFAQEAIDDSNGHTDTADIKKKIDPSSASLFDLLWNYDTFKPWDSGFAYIHRYNPAHHSAQAYAHLGITNTATQILGTPAYTPFGFTPGLDVYNLFNYSSQTTQFYKATTPLTAFNYVQGAGAFTQFKAMHTQNFSPTWNIVLKTQSFSNQDGVYNTNANKSHMHKATSFASRFISQNQKFKQYLTLNWNRARRAESWGFDTSSPYIGAVTGLFVPRGFYVPNVTTASSIYKNHEHNLYTIYQLSPKLHAYHSVQHNQTQLQYLNSNTADSKFTQNTPFFNTARTKDSSTWQQWSNQLGVNLNTASKINIYWQTDRNTYNSIYKKQTDIYYMNALHLNMQIKTGSIMHRSQAAVMLSGMQAGDYLLKHNAVLPFAKWQATAGVHLQKYSPQQKFNNWATNLQQYNQTLAATSINQLYLQATTKLGKLHVLYNLTAGNSQNYTILNNALQTQQINNNYFVQNAHLAITLGNWHLHHQLIITHNTDTHMAAPKISANLHYYYQSKLFKGAMLARTGVDIFYQSRFTGYQYLPNTMQFALAKYTLGNLLIADAYFSGEVKNFSFFAKAENLSSMIKIGNLSTVQQGSQWEPYPYLNLKLGINWRFFN